MKWGGAWNVSLLLALVTVFLEMSSSFAQIMSRGSKCVGTGRTGCDSEITNLICFEGTCRCPEALTMHSADLPTNLNTLWNLQLGKCFAVKGARCDIHATKKRVECFPGTKCIPDPNNHESGTCGTSQLITSWPVIVVSIIFGIYYVN